MNSSQEAVFQRYFYQVYGNGTVSNGTLCYLWRQQNWPSITEEGSVLNGVNCDSPVKKLAGHGAVGIVSACLGFLLIPLLILNIGKFNVAGATKGFQRRAEFCWMILLILVMAVSGFAYIDVDRSLVQGISLCIFSFCFHSNVPMLVLVYWHYVSTYGFIRWRERTVVGEEMDGNERMQRIEKMEYGMPVVVYILAIIGFLLAGFHSWGKLARGEEGVATNARFKASAILNLLGLLCCEGAFCMYLIEFGRDRRKRWMSVNAGGLMVLIREVYGCLSSWNYHWNASNPKVNPGIAFGLGYLPELLLGLVICLYGLLTPGIAQVERLALQEVEEEKEKEEQEQEQERMAATRTTPARASTGLPPPPYQEVFVNEAGIEGEKEEPMEVRIERRL
ncbi:DUF2434 family conserved fungal multispanning membrane protein [Schizosaccharomyces osmophilus]|uniref:DUF2434 family conserved fungal multispanning membrane protein n=1 Tax=Schizosaccharomyces osmophilus TaxID=2545709 RepID=A0AAE9WAN9_9SCHI|nr:DUF2434 family conserved fungal multispanning membrane protein [Schizosaccharomyces osmophilus]WBW71946.1 DUF2434 family conserved fungal multispanning membrane protein [Schizosaccharomyces osmophilus]